MKSVVTELRWIIREFSEQFSLIPEAEFTIQPSPSKWSKKQIVGHLIDSAQNNLRRFICGQYEVKPHIVYDQDFWVSANHYQQASRQDVIVLWKLINERICAVLDAVPEQKYSNVCNTGKKEEQLHSIEWLAHDYVKHMKHHINQIISGSFDVTYP